MVTSCNPSALSGPAGAPATQRPGSISRRARLFPIVAMQLYLNFTVFLFAAGPWEWPVENGLKLYGFLALAHAALLLGYLSAGDRPPAGYHGRSSPERLVKVSLVLVAALLLPTSRSRTGSWIPNAAGGLSDLATAYFEGNEAASLAGGNVAEYARMLLGPWLFLLLPLTIYYWPRLSRAFRLASLACMAGFLSIYVARGTNKALADVVLLLPCLLVARYFAGTLRISWRRGLVLLGVTAGLFAAFLAFFAASNIARLRDGDASEYMPLISLQANADNFLVRHLPGNAKFGALGLTSYVTQGYYGLSLALEEPFVPMYGVGNSIFLYVNAAKATGAAKIEEMPYPVRVEQSGGWDAYVQWSSIYPWIASDVSFLGVIVVVFVVGRLFAMAWCDTLAGQNPWAVAMLAQLLIMLFYFPANNQMMQTGEAFFSFYGVLAFWLYTRKDRSAPQGTQAAEPARGGSSPRPGQAHPGDRPEESARA